MTRKDILLYVFWAAAVLIVLGRPLVDPALAFANFGDLYTYHYPMRHLVMGGLQSGHLPFWNPYIFCGLPLSANSQAVLFYPVSILGAVLPLLLAFSWDYALHLLWGGLGVLLLARREGLSAAAGLFLATLYCFCPFVVYRIMEGIPTLLACLAWAPWCWLALFSRRPGFLAAVWALQFLSGHPQFLIVNALGMAVWALLRKDRFSWLGAMAIEAGGALLLAAVQWIPTARFLALSVRRDWPEVFTSAYSVAPSAFLTWLHPGILGNVLDGTFADVPSIFFETTGLFIGWLGLAAAAAGLRLGRGRTALVLILLGAGLACGDHGPLYRAVLSRGPASLLRTPARYLLLSLWGLLLAAGAAAGLMERRRMPSPAIKILLLVLAFGELLAWDFRFLKSQPAEPFLHPNAFVAHQLAGRPFRVLTDLDLANPNKTMLYRAMNVNGYEAFYLRGYPAYAARSEGGPAADPSRAYLRHADTLEMRRAGVGYLLTGGGGLVQMKNSLGLAYAAAGRRPLPSALEVDPQSPQRWRVRGRAPPSTDRIVVTLPAYPGWRARLDGRPVPLEPWDIFQAARFLPKEGNGYFTLTLDFRPEGWDRLCLISALAWGAWLALSLKPLGRREAAA